MRIAICTLSAVLLSGCSWLGMGSGSSANGCAVGHNQYGGAWNQGADCGAGYGGAYGGAGAYGAGQSGWGYGAGAAGYGSGANGYGAGAGGFGLGAAGGAYGAGGAGYGAGAGGFGPGGAAGYGGGFDGSTGYAPGVGGFGPGAGYSGANAAGFGQGNAAFGGGVGGFGPGVGGFGPGAGGVTTLGAGAGYGSAIGGVAGGQYAQYATGGQVVGGNVQQIQGAPIYVPRPYPAYYQAPRLRLGGAAQPLGLALFAGASSFNDGNVFGGEGAKPAGATGRSVSALDAISYDHAFGEGDTYGGALEYDLDRNNTAFLSASRTEYDGQVVSNGTITQDNTGSGGTIFSDVGKYEFSDLEETTVEAGLRHYVSNNGGLRPYVAGSAGFTHNNDVTLTTYTDDVNVVAHPETQEIIRGSWQPTAAGMIGAEFAAGPNFGLGVETGLRWTNERATATKSEDTWSVPVQVRGRIAF